MKVLSKDARFATEGDTAGPPGTGNSATTSPVDAHCQHCLHAHTSEMVDTLLLSRTAAMLHDGVCASIDCRGLILLSPPHGMYVFSSLSRLTLPRPKRQSFLKAVTCSAERLIYLIPELCRVHPVRSAAVGVGKRLLPRLLWQVPHRPLPLHDIISGPPTAPKHSLLICSLQLNALQSPARLLRIYAHNSSRSVRAGVHKACSTLLKLSKMIGDVMQVHVLTLAAELRQKMLARMYEVLPAGVTIEYAQLG